MLLSVALCCGARSAQLSSARLGSARLGSVLGARRLSCRRIGLNDDSRTCGPVSYTEPDVAART